MRDRSLFRGISVLGNLSRQQSQHSLDWDNYESPPTYLSRLGTIPIVRTPSSSLESGDEYNLTTNSLGNQVGETSHLNLADVGVNMPDQQDITKEAQSLLLAMNAVEVSIDIFPQDLMTADRLASYSLELQGIKDKYMDFTNKVLVFGMSFLNHKDPPKAVNGQPMNVDFWKEAERKLFQKMINHEKEIRKIASELQSSQGMTEFEKKDLAIKEEQLKLVRDNQIKNEKDEKLKANALAQAKYDEVLVISTELDEFLDQIPDWKKASRSDVMIAMKELGKWASKFSELNKAYREFTVATSTYLLPNEQEKMEECLEETTRKYNEVTRDIRDEDRKRELYSLAGANSEQVKLPYLKGSVGEDFVTFKEKLLLALEKNRVPVSDKVEKLRGCLAGQALALVPEKTKSFDDAIAVLEEAFGNPEKVLSAKLNEIDKIGRCPPETINGKWNYQAVVNFCLKVEVLIKDLLDLGD